MQKYLTLKNFGLWLGLILFSLLWFGFDPVPGKPIGRMAAIAALMAIWWITEPIPIAGTSLIPMALFPFVGIMSAKDVAPFYMNSIIFLYVGGFIIALAMERWELHRRIALFTLLILGKNPERLVLGFMCACVFLSAWISNTAAAVAMLPVGMAVLAGIEEQSGKEKTKNLGVCLMLGIAYACSIGGISTLVGTPVNLIFKNAYESAFPELGPISFLQWSMIGVPVTISMLFATWFLLVRVLFKPDKSLSFAKDLISKQYKALGPMSREEKWVAAIFGLTGLLWIFRIDLQVGETTIPGWTNLLNLSSSVDDGTIAIAMSLLLFLIPARKDGEKSRLVTNAIIKKIPWDVVLLFGGGFAMAQGLTITGLSQWFGDSLFSALGNVSQVPMIAGVATTMTFATEVTSNTALSQMIQPILATVAKSQGIHPMLIMVPAALSISMAFMLPVATPPNAIVFGSGRITIRQMVLAGFILDLIGVVISVLAVYLIGIPLFLS